MNLLLIVSKRLSVLAAVVLATVTVSCKQEQPESSAAGQEGTRMSLNICIANPGPKTSYTPDNGALKCSWNAGDSVSVVSINSGKVATIDQFVTASGGETALFEGPYHGKDAESVICIYPPLDGTKGMGYYSRKLPGSNNGSFYITIGNNCLTFTGLDRQVLSQPGNADASNIALTDVMTGTIDLANPGTNVTMVKHSDVLEIVASIPALASNEKVRTMTLSLSKGAPFALGAATLPLASGGLWTTSSAGSTVTLNYGTYKLGVFSGLTSSTHSLTSYIPVLPLEGASALQGNEARNITIKVHTDKAVYEAVKEIPAKSGSTYSYALTGGRLNRISATLQKVSDVGVPTGTCEPDKGWVFFDEGPYTLNTTVEADPGSATFKLVRDLSLQTGAADVVLSRQVTIGSNGELNVSLGSLDPGFYQVRINNDPKFMIGVRPDALLCSTDAKADFDAFWTQTFAELDAIPLNAEWTPVPEYTNSVRACYEIRYQSLGGAISGGILSIPVAAGKYPVKLKFMGYGNNATYFHPNSSPGVIEFEVSIRSQGLFETGSKWDTQGLESKETYYYRGAYCDVKRAIDFVMSLDKADTEHVVSWGSSQGGALSAISTAIDSRIKALSTTAPFLTDFADYYKLAYFPMNNDIFPAADKAGIPRSTVLDMLTYFDLKNFAPRIKCPVLMIVGLQDYTCPPHNNFAFYNNLGTSDKRYVILPDNIHNEWSNPITGQTSNAFLKQYMY